MSENDSQSTRLQPACYPALRWSELERDKQKSHYWAAIPDNADTIFDSWDYEIVYVYFDGKWSVIRLGETKREPLDNFRFLFMLDLPDDISG